MDHVFSPYPVKRASRRGVPRSVFCKMTIPIWVLAVTNERRRPRHHISPGHMRAGTVRSPATECRSVARNRRRCRTLRAHQTSSLRIRSVLDSEHDRTDRAKAPHISDPTRVERGICLPRTRPCRCGDGDRSGFCRLAVKRTRPARGVCRQWSGLVPLKWIAHAQAHLPAHLPAHLHEASAAILWQAYWRH